MRTIDNIITKVSGKHGAPTGRVNIGVRPDGQRVYDCYVPMNGAYDTGGVYWGCPSYEDGIGRMRVYYTKDMSYVEFYREES